MSTRNNEVLGYIQCSDCGERGTVHKTNRGKARFLYKRCGCGCDQRTGAAVQTHLYTNTEWLGEKPPAPPNLKVQEPQKEPETQPSEEPKQEPKTTEKKPLLLALAAGASIALLALMGRKV